MRALMLVLLNASVAHADDPCTADKWCTISAERVYMSDVTRDVTKGNVVGVSDEGLFAYDGKAFVPMPGAPEGNPDYYQFPAVASAGGVVWAVRHNSVEDMYDPITGELVMLKRGKWIVKKAIKKVTLRHLVAVSATQGWAAGAGDLKKHVDDRSDDRAVIVRWDGKRTKLIWPTGVTEISDLAAADAKSAYFTSRQGLGRVDAKGKVTWLPVPKEMLFEGEANYYRVHRAGPDDLYVLGQMGLVHYEKGTPTVVKLPRTGSGPDTHFVAIASSSPTDVTVIDTFGKALHYDGKTWTLEDVGQTHLAGMVRTGDGSTLVFGDRLVRHAPR